MGFTIIYKGNTYDAQVMSLDGSSVLEGWLQFEPEVPWLGYYVERPKNGHDSTISEETEVFLPDDADCSSGTCKNLERRLHFSAYAPPGMLGVKVDGDELFIQGKPLSDYLKLVE
jgi:hypothetical protein